ncbi:MAG TPA: TPM domain-containing protein [Chitinophagaceae bacterium]|nr:TPM domain-containing protein [Chitinophagaceae bacterium]
MGILSSLFPGKRLLSQEDEQLIVTAIQAGEKRTSGEIRVYIESHCRFVDPLDRAAEVFGGLKMHETRQRNGVLVYVAVKDRQLAVFADQGIHEKAGPQFWNDTVKTMLQHFNRQQYGTGIAGIVSKVGEALCTHFPYDAGTDKNELPDDIVFGK